MPALRMLLLLLLGALAASCADRAEACPSIGPMANTGADASAALLDCIRQAQPGGRVELPPGTYRLQTPIVIAKPVILTTRGLAASAPPCADLRAGSCATLRLDPARGSGTATMPVQIDAEGFAISHLVVEGAGQSALQRAHCSDPSRRSLGGGLRVTASNFQLRKSVLRNFTCFTAVEIFPGARSPQIEDNLIGPNGDHRPGEIWADGVTIHDTDNALVRRNLFVDNTDVQLIFGGCRNCLVEGNRFRHSLAFDRASFAELMLHSWPKTSGDYTGTVVRSNSIDCGAERRCGYGIMVGAAPWYPGRMSGGEISGNSVTNAMVAINIDGLTGPVTFRNNQVRLSGGLFPSDCGPRQWPAVNVAPQSRRFVSGDPSNAAEGSMPTSGCLLNRTPPR